MSVDNNQYIGPFLECKVEMVEKSWGRPGWCPKCKEFTIARKFCSDCGTNTEEKSIKNFEPLVRSGVVRDEINEKMHYVLHDSQIFWLPNIHWPEEREIETDEDGFGIERMNESVVDEVMSFQTFFSKQIKIIEKHYGEENCSFGYGLIIWQC